MGDVEQDGGGGEGGRVGKGRLFKNHYLYSQVKQTEMSVGKHLPVPHGIRTVRFC
jgi:hypothetical protein